MDKDQSVDITIGELFEFRSALMQCEKMLVSHEKDLDILRRRSDQELELDRGVASDLRVMQREVSDLKSIAAENRAAIRNLFISAVLAVVGAYLTKYIK